MQFYVLWENCQIIKHKENRTPGIANTNTTKHNIDFENVKTMARKTNLERRLFSEVWYSTEDPNS